MEEKVLEEEKHKAVDNTQDQKAEKEAHAVYEWTPEMTEKAEAVLASIKFSFNDNMYSTRFCKARATGTRVGKVLEHIL